MPIIFYSRTWKEELQDVIQRKVKLKRREFNQGLQEKPCYTLKENKDFTRALFLLAVPGESQRAGVQRDIQEPYIISCLANRGPPCVQLQNHLHVFIDHIWLKQRMLGNEMSCTQPVRVWTMASTSCTQHESTLFYVSALYMHDNWAMKLQPLSCPSFRQTCIYSHPLLHNSSIKGLWSLTSCMSYLKGNVNSHPTLPPLLKGITGNTVLQQSDFCLLYYTRDDQSFMDRATSHPHAFETISKTGYNKDIDLPRENIDCR